jgi:hypothetical protein
MKIWILFVVALLIGLSAGSVFTRRHADHEVAAVVTQMMEASEASDAMYAGWGMCAIAFIQSGDTTNALRVLSNPIADYYACYAKLEHKDERMKKTLASIDQFARTHQFVGDAITNRMQGKY